jgi:hypothetical protein
MNEKVKLLPPEMRDWYFPFDWNLERLWALDVPVETRPLSELRWHFDIPIWGSTKGKHFDLSPAEVLNNPGRYPRRDEKIEKCDISYPIDMMFTVDRYAIIDGIHRLVKHEKLGLTDVKVRIIPREMIPLFEDNWRADNLLHGSPNPPPLAAAPGTVSMTFGE